MFWDVIVGVPVKNWHPQCEIKTGKALPLQSKPTVKHSIMTTQKTWMGIRICSYVAIVLCAAWAVFYVFNFYGLLTSKGWMSRDVDWTQRAALKIAFFVLDVFSIAITIGLCVKAALNFLKGTRDGVVFPKSNVKLFFWLALAYFVHRLCWANEPILFREGFNFGYTHSNIVIPFCILFFAFMYKIAADAVEENNLTV